MEASAAVPRYASAERDAAAETLPAQLTASSGGVLRPARRRAALQAHICQLFADASSEIPQVASDTTGYGCNNSGFRWNLLLIHCDCWIARILYIYCIGDSLHPLHGEFITGL
jgi:hypothetical protein